MALVSRELINRFRKTLELYSERELARLKRADAAALNRIKKTTRPTQRRVTPQEVVDRLYEKFPLDMERLAQKKSAPKSAL